MKNFFILCLLVCTTHISAQLNDLARADFTIIPSKGSDVEYTRSRLLFNAPIKLSENQTYLLLGLDYSNIQITFEDENLPFDRDEVNDFQLLDFVIGYTQKINDQWRFGGRFSPGVSTNLTAKELTIDDVFFSIDLLMIKEYKLDEVRKKRLVLGVSYSGNRGFNFPLPYVNFYYKWSEKWSYNLGVPKSNLQYHFTAKHRLKAFAQLDGFTANVQKGVALGQEQIARSINLSLIIGGLQYEYHLTKHWQLYARSAYIFSSGNNFRDKDREDVFTLNTQSTLYLRTGIRFKI